MPDLVEEDSSADWTLYRIEDGADHYYLQHRSGTVHGLFSERERDHLGRFLRKIAAEVEELTEQRQELDNLDQVEEAPFLHAVAASEHGVLGWEIRFYSAPDYDGDVFPMRTIGISDARLRELADSGLLMP